MNAAYPRPRSRQGVVIGTGTLVALVVIIAVLMGVSVLSFTNSVGAQVSTTTTTVTSTNISTSVVNVGYNPNNTGLDPQQIYAYANQSIVTLQGYQVVNTFFGQQQEGILGSGFVVQYNNQYYVVTNYHVAGATSNLTMTFSDGNAYPAKVIGSDPYSDMAVVVAESAPLSEFHPLPLVSSDNLRVGQYVLAIGNPFGISGTMTFGIISQLGQSIQDPTAGNFSIAGVIQFSAPINPGNSGGALLNANGSVIGMTTATVSGSQGIGFAIPSSTIIRELPSLVSSGTYTRHSYMGIGVTDMNYQLSKAQGTNVTYGVLIESLEPGGPAAKDGLRAGNTAISIGGTQYLVGGDIIVSMNGTKIINENALSTYLDDHTLSGQTVNVGIIRAGHYMTVNLLLAARPPPPT